MRAELERRPLLVAAIGFILGLTLALHPIHLLFLVPAVWVLKRLALRAILVASVAGGVLLGPGPDPPFIGSTYVSGDWTVVSLPYLEPGVQSCYIRQGDVHLVLTYPGPVRLVPGSVVNLRGVAKPPKEGSEARYRLEGLDGRIQVGPSGLAVVQGGPWIQRLAVDWRDQFLRLSASNLPGQYAAAADSICFHTKGLLDEDTQSKVYNSGTVHLLTASGLQALLLAQALLWLLSRLPIPRFGQLVAVALAMALYAIANGLPATIVRMAFMSLIANSAYLVRREPDWPSALGLTSILYLACDPNKVYDPTFQLSFVAVLFISMFAEQVKWKAGFEAWLYRMARRSLRASVVAFVVVTPIVAQAFGRVSIWMVPAGLLLLISVVPIVMISMAAVPLSLASPLAGGLAIRAMAPLLSFVFAVLNAFGQEDAVAKVPWFSPYWLVPYYLLLVVLWRPPFRRA